MTLRFRWFLLSLALARLRQPPPSAAGLVSARREFDELAGTLAVPAEVRRRADDVDGQPLEWLWQAEREPIRTILYVHGGAYAMGSVAAGRRNTILHTRAGDVRSAAVTYRLAPEAPYPAGLDDVTRAWEHVTTQVDPRAVVVMGESAGGGLALGLLQRLRDHGLALPAGAVLISPWVDLTLSAPSVRQRAWRDVSLRPAFLAVAAAAYTADARAASPLFADMTGLPPLLITVGSSEVLHDDSTRLAAAVRAAGGEAELITRRGMPHCYPGYADQEPIAQRDVGRIHDFVHDTIEAAHARR